MIDASRGEGPLEGEAESGMSISVVTRSTSACDRSSAAGQTTNEASGTGG